MSEELKNIIEVLESERSGLNEIENVISIIVRKLELPYNKINNMNNINQGEKISEWIIVSLKYVVNFWIQVIKECLYTNNNEINIINIVRQYFLFETQEDVGELIDSEYILARALSKCCFNLILYKCYKMKFRDNPSFLNRSIITNDINFVKLFANGHFQKVHIMKSLDIFKSIIKKITDNIYKGKCIILFVPKKYKKYM